jgi:flagellar biosynthesis protein FlhB
MSEAQGDIPPGAGRVAAAARAGLFPRTPLISTGTAFLCVAFIFYLFFEEGSAALTDFLGQGIEMAVSSGTLPLAVLPTQIGIIVYKLLAFLLVVFLGAFLGAAIPALWAKRKRGRTAVPLPQIPKAKTTQFVLRMTGALVFTVLALYVLKNRWQPLSSSGSPIAGAQALFTELTILAYKLPALAAFVMIMVGITELLTYRYLILRSLFLDSYELRLEQRAAGGDASVRRERLRRFRQPKGR